MVTIYRILSWTRYVPYICSVVFFFLLTFPGMKNINYHMDSGYLSYVIIGSCLVLFIHVGLIYLLLKWINSKHRNEKQLLISFIERFNILVGVLVVILFEGLCSDYFTYREWAYGVSRAEAVFEKVDNEWSLKQIEKSKEASIKMNKSIIDYTESVYLKWQNLKSK